MVKTNLSYRTALSLNVSLLIFIFATRFSNYPLSILLRSQIGLDKLEGKSKGY